MNMLNFKLFERQLHVLFIIIIIHIFTPVMHVHKVDKANAIVQGFMFCKMLDK